MIKRRSQVLTVWFLAADLALTAAAWVGAYLVRFRSGWIPAHAETLPDLDQCWRTLPLVLLIAAVAFRLTGQYDIHRLRRLREELVSVGKGTLLMFLLVITTLFNLR